MPDDNLNIDPDPIVDPDPNPIDDPANVNADPAVIDGDPAPPGDEPTDDPQKGGAQKRITELNSKWRAEQEARAKSDSDAAYWKGVAEGKSQQPAAQPITPEPKEVVKAVPMPHEYDTNDEYSAALTKHINEQVSSGISKGSQEHTQQQKSTARMDQVMNAAGEMPGIVDLANSFNANPFMTDVMMDAADGPNLPKIFNYLGSNRAEATKILRLPAAQQAKEIGRIEGRLLTPNPKPKTNTGAPAPTKTVGSGVGDARTETDQSKMTLKEKMAVWDKKRLEDRGMKR